MIDPFGRHITYLRLSVTDRCDLRCAYCMSEHMTFLPRKELLTLEELERLSGAFVDLGVRKIRLTGGEPLVRKGIMTLVEGLGRQLDTGDLQELTLTSNGTRLEEFADGLAAAGVKRINISLDTLDPDKFRTLTRGGQLARTLAGLDAAQAAGLHIKLNVVALKDTNENEIPEIVGWAHQRGMDVSLIETMPLGEIDDDRMDQYLPLSVVRERLEEEWRLTPLALRTGGPSRYVKVEETGGRLGFITPLTNNFCEGCNRVRVTCTGVMYMCLGQSDKADLRAPLRAGASDEELRATIVEAISRKPKAHDFAITARGEAPALARHMSMTGG